MGQGGWEGAELHPPWGGGGGLWAGGLWREVDPGIQQGLEKQDLCIGSTAEERGRWVSHSSGSQLEEGGGG